MKTLSRMLIYTLSFFPIHSIGQTLTSSNATNEGGALQLINPLKTANNIANNWTLYNMTGQYGNSLQFWNYGNGGFYGSRFTILDNGWVGIGTNIPIAQLDVSGDVRFKATDDRSGIGALTIETNNGTNLKLGGNTNYSWIQSHNSKPLYINELGNNTIFNLVGGNVGIGVLNPSKKLEVATNTSAGEFRLRPTDGLYQDYRLDIVAAASEIGAVKMSIKDNVFLKTYGYYFLSGLSLGVAGYEDLLHLKNNGNVGIGTTNPTSKLTVAGNINSREVKVSVDAGADFVFEKDYALPSLQEVEKFVTENKHLPEIASAKEMQKEGINLSEMNIKLLQKIEELTLYMIEQEKKNTIQSKEIEKLKEEKESYKIILERLTDIEKKIR